MYFLDELRPIAIPVSVIRELGGHKSKWIVQGFVPVKDEMMQNILKIYGSLSAFFDNFSTGLKSKDVSILDHIAEVDSLQAMEIEVVDEIMRGKDIDLLLQEWELRKHDEAPEAIEVKVQKIKRNVTVVRQMKERCKNECQICGFTFRQNNGNLYSEVAHIAPIKSKKKGVDTPSNMLVLCANHHKMLDLGGLKILSVTEYYLDGKKDIFRQPMFELPA